jgi:hypothetical protein
LKMLAPDFCPMVSTTTFLHTKINGCKSPKHLQLGCG